MAQLRHDFPKFKALNTEILVVVPNGPKMIGIYTKRNAPSYLILSDKGSRVAALYYQNKRFFSLGAPAVFLVNQFGELCYIYYSNFLTDEPDNREPLAVLAQMIPQT